MTTYSKKYAKVFYDTLCSNFLKELDNNGLKIEDPDLKENFYPFLTNVLQKALDITFKGFLPPKSK